MQELQELIARATLHTSHYPEAYFVRDSRHYNPRVLSDELLYG